MQQTTTSKREQNSPTAHSGNSAVLQWHTPPDGRPLSCSAKLRDNVVNSNHCDELRCGKEIGSRECTYKKGRVEGEVLGRTSAYSYDMLFLVCAYEKKSNLKDEGVSRSPISKKEMTSEKLCF